jgi:hypothetical protein
MTTDTTTEDVDTSKLSKIRALLDKAESTDSPEEAEALTAKALEWMEKYRIDEMMIADAAPLQDRGEIIEARIAAGSGPYVNARIGLASAIARNHSVRLLIETSYRGKTILFSGYETDVALTEMLYTSLLVQATRAVDSPATLALKPRSVHGISFKRAFLLSFGDRIAQRLWESSAAAADAYEGEGRSVALVLADRTKDVDAYLFNRYGKVKAGRRAAPASCYAGMKAGADAADAADLSTNRRVGANETKALSA